MSIPASIEKAVYDVLRLRSDWPEDITFRLWQDLSSDAAWSEDEDRVFPAVDIRCSPPSANPDSFRTFTVICSIMAATRVPDDKDHKQVASIYAGVQQMADALFFQSSNTPQEELNKFISTMSDLEAEFNFGAIILGEPVAPQEDGGVNVIGVSLVVHYTRGDF